jgi:hypothetical protein
MKKESIEEVAERMTIGIKEENYKDGVIDGYNYSQQQISELKEQRDEMLQMLENCLKVNKHHNFNGHLVTDRIEQLIKKVKNE